MNSYIFRKRSLQKTIGVPLLGAGFLLSFPQSGLAAPELKLPFPAGESWYLTRGYNTASHKDYGGSTSDDRYALDFAKGCDDVYNKPALAVAAGTIQSARKSSTYGNTVLIDHGNGFVSRYAHLKSISVKQGHVNQGQEIGRVGNTGNVTSQSNCTHKGTHLHFAMYHNGEAYKPEPMDGYTNFRPHRFYKSGNSGSLTVQDLWVKSNAPIYAGEKNGFDAQFKLKNNSSRTVTVAKVVMSIHQSNHKHDSDMKVVNNVRIYAGRYYHMPKTFVDSPATPGQYKVVAKIYQNGWKDLASESFTVIKNPSQDVEGMVESVFDDLEKSYGSYFPPHQNTLKSGNDYYRYYPNGSWLYLYQGSLWYNLYDSGWNNTGWSIQQWYDALR